MKNISRSLVALVSLAVVAWIVWYFLDIVSYIMVAWILSMIGQPFMRLFQRIRIGRFRMGSSLAAMLTIICYFVVFTALIAMFAPLVVEQARNIAGVDYYAIIQTLEVPINQINDKLMEIGLIKDVSESPINQINQNLSAQLDPNQIANIFASLIGAAGNMLIAIFSIVFITFFFLKESGLFQDVMLALTPSRYDNHVRNTIQVTSRMLTRYFAGIFIQITVITAVVSTALGLLGVSNALLIGFFAALINVIPYIGPILGAIFGVFIVISSNLGVDFYGEMLPLIGKVVLVFALMQMIDNLILQPLIFSTSVMAHPLEIFIIILVGAKLGGVGGMIVAIPVYTIFRVIAKVFLSEFKVVQMLTESITDSMSK